MAEEANLELEAFRKQWQEEVIARAKGSSSGNKNDRAYGSPKRGFGTTQAHQTRLPPASTGPNQFEEGAFDGPDRNEYHDLVDRDVGRRLREEGYGVLPSIHEASHEPGSALEHYEKAVAMESQGNLGDSLKLYRKAYRLDAEVDRIYKDKHFPPSSSKSKPTNPNPSNAPATVPNPAHHSLDGPPKSISSELIVSFSKLSISPAPPSTDQSPPPPCPIAKIPSELLVEILERTAALDIASFARLSLVCKRFAYLIATEDQIWKWVCFYSGSGFQAMHYTWACSISGSPLLPEEDDTQDEAPSDAPSICTPTSPLPAFVSLTQKTPLYPTISLTPLYPSYKTMFRTRPRVRFNGCYISTVNYIRPGASTAYQVSWNTPVHIVTYYRYLRFFRDGTCASLLTTSEPLNVVHHLRKENMPLNHQCPHPPAPPTTTTTTTTTINTTTSGAPPSAVMKQALRGRWHLGPPNPNSLDEESNLTIETEGVDPDKYVYRMDLALRSSGGRDARGARNTKLVWRGFWSWNRYTGDWAEFALRNDRAYVWSRVGSYGAGG